MGKPWIRVLGIAAAVVSSLAISILASAGMVPIECHVTVDGASRLGVLVDELPDQSVEIICENILLGSLETAPVLNTDLEQPSWKIRLVAQDRPDDFSTPQVALQPGCFNVQLSGRTPSTEGIIGGEVRDLSKMVKFLAVSGTSLIEVRVVSKEYQRAEQAVAALRADIQALDDAGRSVPDSYWALYRQAEGRLKDGKPGEALQSATNTQSAVNNWKKEQDSKRRWIGAVTLLGLAGGVAIVAVAYWCFIYYLPNQRDQEAKEER